MLPRDVYAFEIRCLRAYRQNAFAAVRTLLSATRGKQHDRNESSNVTKPAPEGWNASPISPRIACAPYWITAGIP